MSQPFLLTVVVAAVVVVAVAVPVAVQLIQPGSKR